MSVKEFYVQRTAIRREYNVFYVFLVAAILISDLGLMWLIPFSLLWGFVKMIHSVKAEARDVEGRGQWYWEYLEERGYTNVPNL